MLKAMRVAKTLQGYTLVELLITIVVIGILATIGVSYYRGAIQDSYEHRAKAELGTMNNAIKLYTAKYNAYPADATRNIPADLNEFIRGEDVNDEWPNAPWPGSVYDYEAWDVDGNGQVETYQISIRFCNESGSSCKFPSEPWATNFDNYSAYYFCVKGYCRSHQSRPYTHSGYCVNCVNNQAVKTPSE